MRADTSLDLPIGHKNLIATSASSLLNLLSTTENTKLAATARSPPLSAQKLFQRLFGKPAQWVR